jgi:hypothetical protein
MPDLTAQDLDRLWADGRDLAEIEEQLRFFSDPPPPAKLLRPCSPGDGVTVLTAAEEDEAQKSWEEAAKAGRFSKFVPASGAASRMFHSILAFLRSPGSEPGPDVLRFAQSRQRFAFHEALLDAVRRLGGSPEDPESLVSALLSPEGLGYEETPKGLVLFHTGAAGPRTPFEEHLIEGSETAAVPGTKCRAHFTVAPEHEPRFRELAKARVCDLEAQSGVRFELSFSIQHPATDTVAVDMENQPFRLEDGTILFRPGGHGALLKNLEDFGGDLVYVKNIDNVVPAERGQTVIRWKRILGGHLASVQKRAFAFQRSLADRPDSVEKALAFLEQNFGVRVPSDWHSDLSPRDFARERLARPIRVCGVVRNQGEPGGGPFWVDVPVTGESPQIVESSQVDMKDSAQGSIWKSSTHFNPVDLVCAVKGPDNRRYSLASFVDREAVFISRKSHGGRELKALERPGLWNGAMARWNTVFVQVPLETFAPVKTVFDLLRPEHQP